MNRRLVCSCEYVSLTDTKVMTLTGAHCIYITQVNSAARHWKHPIHTIHFVRRVSQRCKVSINSFKTKPQYANTYNIFTGLRVYSIPWAVFVRPLHPLLRGGREGVEIIKQGSLRNTICLSRNEIPIYKEEVHGRDEIPFC